jgi:predicted RNase H-like HicB family nuclease
MSTRKFHVSIEKDEDGSYLGRCKELPEAVAEASTLGELKERIVVAIDLALQEIEEGKQQHQLITA